MSSRTKVVGLLVAPLVALGACNALVGVDDVHLRDDGSGGTSSEGGTGASRPGGAPGVAGSGVGGSGVAGSETTAGGHGGEPGRGGAGGEGHAGESGNGGEPSQAGAGGEGGGGGEVDPPHPCPALGEEKPVRGRLKLVQFATLDASRGRVNVSSDGKNAYATTWGSITQHFTRDAATGMLTPKSTASVYNGIFSALSPTSKLLYVAGINGNQFYPTPIAADGTIASVNSQQPAGYKTPSDAIQIGDSTLLLASGDSIRAIKNDVYDATDRAPGTYGGVQRLSRSRDYIYWAEYSNWPAYPNASPHINRARFQCDGSLGPREAFPTSTAPFDVAACDKTGYVYVPHPSIAKGVPGFVDVIDLSTCKDDFASCKPKLKLTGTEIPGLYAPVGIRLSTDCSTLYLSNGTDSGSQFLVLSMKDPEAPKLLQTFEPGKDYDGVKITGGIYSTYMSVFEGYLYAPVELGDGVAVFKAE